MNQQENYKEEIEAAVAAIQPIDSYQESFISQCQDYRPRLSTGLLALDKALHGGLTSELYVLAAETGTGKSAFLMSIAQKIAQSGTNVLYFSLEMVQAEFIARGISTISYEHHLKDPRKKPVTAPDILLWSYDEASKSFSKLAYSTYDEYCAEYFRRYKGRLFIVEGGSNGLTAKKIANMAALFQKKRGPVVVFVDYLQIIKADPEEHAQSDRKTKTDVSMILLKSLASQVGMPVITVSSVSRGIYGERISTSSFKESGDTEYTGGILLGWNWAGVTDQKDEVKRNEEQQACEKRGYRKMTLEILKNRNAARGSAVHLKYYPAYQYFEEDGGWEDIARVGTLPFAERKRTIVKG